MQYNYFKSTETARHGDLIATRHLGQCHIEKLEPDRAVVWQVGTGKTFFVNVGECFLIEHPAFADTGKECHCVVCGGDRGAGTGDPMNEGDTQCAPCADESGE